MALTATPLACSPAAGQATVGGRKMWFGFLTLDSSYVTGGYTFDPTLFGMTRVTWAFCGPMSSGTRGMRFTPAAGALGTFQAYTATGGAEAGNGVSLAGITVPVVVVGV